MRIMRTSIKNRLLISHWILTFVMATVMGFISIAWFRGEQENRLNDFLLSEAQRIKSGVEAFYEGGVKNATMRQEDLKDFLYQLMNARLNRAIPYKTTLVVFDPRGALLAKSNDAIPVTDVPSISGVSEQNKITINNAVKKPYRMISSVLEYDGQIIGYFNLGMLNEPLVEAVSIFFQTMALFLVSIVFIFGILGSVLIYLIFNSIKSMTASADKISETRLDLRLPVPPGRDEIHYLSITLNRLLARLENDYKFQEDLVSQLSHQLRTPLTIMRGRNENALAGMPESQRERTVLEDNLSSIDAITSLLHTLLELARLDSHVDRVNLLPVDPAKALDSVVTELTPLWEDKNIGISWHLAPIAEDRDYGSGIRINADEKYLKQAFFNILGNAYKYSPIGGKITIEIAKKKLNGESFCGVTIANQGPPIPEESLALVFKKFYRVKNQDDIVSDNSTGGVEPGFGLGLSICKTLVELQNGTIRAFNPPSGGAAFEILFPMP